MVLLKTLLAVLASCLLASPAWAGTGIEVGNFGLCMQAFGSIAAGTNVDMAVCDGGSDQDFEVSEDSLGGATVRNVQNADLCVGMSGTSAKLTGCSSSPSWITRLVKLGTGARFGLQNEDNPFGGTGPLSPDNCLDTIVSGGSAKQLIYFSECHLRGNQLFGTFQPLMLENNLLKNSMSLCVARSTANTPPTDDPLIMRYCDPGDARQLWVHDRITKHLHPYGFPGHCVRSWTGNASPVVRPCETWATMDINIADDATRLDPVGVSTMRSNDNGHISLNPSIVAKSGSSLVNLGSGDPGLSMHGKWRRWKCRAFADHYYNVGNGCRSCQNSRLIFSSGCSECINSDIKLSGGCNSCENPNRALSSLCQTCVSPNFVDNTCSSCNEGYNLNYQCQQCFFGRDASTACAQCRPGFSSESDCTICDSHSQDVCDRDGFFIDVAATAVADVAPAADTPTIVACRHFCKNLPNCKWWSFASGSGSTTCAYSTASAEPTLATVASSSSISSAVFAPDICTKGPGFAPQFGCTACRNTNWDLSSNCTQCIGLRTEESNCLACPNTNFNLADDCNSCNSVAFSTEAGCDGTCKNDNYIKDSGTGCEYCRAGFQEPADPANEGCLTCRPGWAAPLCNSCEGSLDINLDCSEDAVNCAVDDVDIWNVTVRLSTRPNSTAFNVTEERCLPGVGPKEVYQYLSCSSGAVSELHRAFECSAEWVYNAVDADYAAFGRMDSYILDAIIALSHNFADDDALTLAARMRAEQLAATWNLVRGRGSAADFVMNYANLNGEPTFVSRFPAPPFFEALGAARQLGTSAAARAARFEAAQTSYRSLLAPHEALKTCQLWFRGFGRCECGSIFNADASTCTAVDEVALANVYSLHMGCAVADGIIGTRASLELLQRTTACVEREVWKQQDLDTVSGLLKLARAAAALSKAEAVSSGDDVLGADLEGLRHDASAALERAARAAAVLSDNRGDAVAQLVSAQRSEALGGAVFDEFGDKVTQLVIQAELDDVRTYMNTLANELSMQMETGFNDVQGSLEGLADLLVGATEVSMEANRENFLTLAQGELSKATSQLLTAATDLQQKRNSIGNLRRSIDGVKVDLDAALGRLVPIGEQIGVKAEEYYECRKAEELAKLARARAVAIFNVVVNAVALVAEAAALVTTFGASQSIASAARTVVREAGEAVVQTIKDEVTNAMQEELTGLVDGGLGALGVDSESLRDQAVGSVGALVGGPGEGGPSESAIGRIFDGEDPGEAIADEALETVKGIGEAVLESAVPFYGSAKGIYEAAKVLSDYNGAKDEVKAEFRENLRKSKEALEQLGEMAAEMGDFAAGMMLEMGQLLKMNIPSKSVIESSSTAIWRSMRLRVIEFAMRTEIYTDFKKDARRRALLADEDPEDADAARRVLARLDGFDGGLVPTVDDEPLLVHEQQSGNVRSLLEARALTTATTTAGGEMRRSLDSKKGCNVRPFAQAGLGAFADYFDELDEVEFFGVALHEQLIEILGTTRDIMVLSVEMRGLASIQASYAAAVTELEKPSGGALATYDAAMREVLQAAFQRTVPGLTSAQPATFERTAQIQDGFLQDVCNAARYRYLVMPETCDFYVADVVLGQGSGVGADVLGQRVEDIKVELQNMRDAWRPDAQWARIPVASSLAVRTAVTLQSTIVTETSTFSWRFTDPVDAMADVATCGYNHEIVAYAMTLESRSNAIQLHPAALESDWYSYSLTMDTAPMIKLDRFGKRHIFAATNKPTDLAVRRARIASVDSEDCGADNNAVQSVVIRRDRHRLCVQTPEAGNFGISPVSPWGTNFTLALGDLAELIADEDLDLDLVMYARLRGFEQDPQDCEASQFVERGVDTAGADSGGADVGVIIGASLAAVVIVGAGAFWAKRVRDNRRKDVPWGKALYVNPAQQALPEI